jgi:phosphate transport system protein
VQPARHRFQVELEALESEIVAESDLAEAAVGKAVRALATRNDRLSDEVIAEDDEVDRRYIDIERRVLDLLATQTPVATDLRLVSAILHMNLHLERVADMAVNIAKIAKVTRRLPTSEIVMSQLQEMAEVAGQLIRTAIASFVRRDLELCLSLPGLDDPIDRLNRGMYLEVMALASDPELLEWGLHMHMVARQLERVGDHAVDIAEQVGFLLTGEFREFTDASHPVEHPYP